jgi:predicted MPP superfamily phosphohydrolase
MVEMRLNPEDIDPTLLRRLEHRIGLYHLIQRLELEQDMGDLFTRKKIQDHVPLGSMLGLFAAISGIKRRGELNAVSPVVGSNRVVSSRLPAEFHGYRILHLTDLHLDGKFDYVDVVASVIGELDYDTCVLTGDYRHSFTDSSRFREQMQRLRGHIRTEVTGVLGNHDSLSMVPWMEDMGYRVLLNESVKLTRGSQAVDVVGVDDYHYFRCSDIERAMRHSEEDFVLMLNHSPEEFRQAAYAGVDLYLCGHTHGGQICFPGGWPPSLNLQCTRRVGSGAWQFREMQGYTSRGVGTSLAHMRFNCPPEIVVHELIRD